MQTYPYYGFESSRFMLGAVIIEFASSYGLWHGLDPALLDIFYRANRGLIY